DVRFDHGFADDAGFGVCGVAFFNDANVHFGARDIVTFGEVSDGVAGVGRVRGKLRDENGFGAAGVGEGFFDACGIGVLLVRHDDLDVGVPGFVGVAVGKKIEAGLACVVDDGDVFRRFTPDGDGADLDVRVLDGNMSASADFDFFL